MLEEGGRIRQATRALRSRRATRRGTLRGKEEAHDYRYFPDPDLLPLVLAEDVDRARCAASLPELPAATDSARYAAELRAVGLRCGRCSPNRAKRRTTSSAALAAARRAGEARSPTG
ncbi:MAG: hypothetical protein RML56_03110 [Burkholderiales bacterium]|nr:hypothetical protein [Burkholderiales bacterium]